MIQLKNVTKYYPLKGGGRHYVVKNISLTLPSHRSLGILGPNGAGKSTLLRLIGGAESVNSGKISTSSSVSWPLGLGVGFQGSLSGRQNVLFVCQINGLSKDETNQVIENVQSFAELGPFFDMPVKSYSSGMRAKLGFGLSISFDFDYYLIDELTSVGDAIFKSKAKAEFKKIKQKASLVFVAHNLAALRDACDSAVFLREGKATYHEDINEGIALYEEYIKNKRKAN
jgi:capsular polysaccharide transport system ATP-binding protein